MIKALRASLCVIALLPAGASAVDFAVSNNGLGYLFNGGAVNPVLTLTRGQTYNFNLDGTVVVHPFRIQSSPAHLGALYNNGVNRNNVNNGTITFVVPNDAPNTLYYACGIHTGMSNAINIIDPPAPPPPSLPKMGACGLVGGWTPEDSQFAITFTRDGKFVFAETSPADAVGTPGFERGTYTLNRSTGAFSPVIANDTNGEWGLSHGGPFVIYGNGNMLVATDNGEQIPLSRVVSPTSAIVGSWIVEEGGMTAVITFRANLTYTFAQDGPAGDGGNPGVESGTYTWDPQTGAFSSVTLVDTDGQWGLSNGSPAFVTVNGNTMTFSDDEVVLTRVAATPGCQGADVDGDGRADVVWRNGSSGDNYLYPLNGTSVGAGEGYLRSVTDLNWRIAGTGDFDGDGKADIFWRNASTGDNYIYFMNGTAIHSEGYVRAVTDLNWEVVGVGDFNGDGKDDVLWRNTVTGENYIYPMNGLMILPSEGYLRTVASHHWQVAGVGKFDAGTTADILWRNSRTGENYIYLMNGMAIVGEGFIRTVAALEWQIAGVGDFTGDGMADILWRNVANGENYVYPMSGTTILAGEGYLRTVADLTWRIAGVGDYDGDGNADVLWRNAVSGDNYLYLMNGTTIAGEGYLRNVADQNWKARHSSPFALRRGPVDGTQVPFATAATGTTWARMDLFTREMSGIIQTSGLTGAFAAHIHLAPRGQDGGIIVNYVAQGPNDWVPAPELMPAANYVHFLTDGTYVNVHTPARSGGEIRGQLE